MKIKDILLYILGFAAFLSIIYFTFISPVFDGISKHGVIGFILNSVFGLLLLCFIYSMTHRT